MNNRYKWVASGDVNAFFGLVLDNLAGLVLIVSLLSGVFQFPVNFALRALVPGTAIGVLVGDLLYFFMAIHLAKKTGSTTVTAMPLGLDTPSIIGTALFVVGPAYLEALKGRGMPEAEAAVFAWQIGICALFASGIFKVICAFGSGWLHKFFPRAGLLGSLTAIALVVISFLPLIDVMHSPVVGLVALAIILTALIGKIPLPGKLPGTVGSLLVAGSIYYIMIWLGLLEVEPSKVNPVAGLWPTEWTAALNFSWLGRMGDTVKYLPIVIPLALATVVGGIDCTESASAAGDKYHSGSIIAVEAIATLVASFCGGIIQTTPYIGHPAYKAMGGRAAYTLATAIFIGLAGVLGMFGFIYEWVPKPAIYPILLFVGLEITAQSFMATPRRHYAAVALACVPALAFLSLHWVGQIFDVWETELAGVKVAELKTNLATSLLLKNGFVITSLLWSSFLASAIDRKLDRGASYLFIAALFTLFGVIHSPFFDAKLFLPALTGKPLFGPEEIWLSGEALQPTLHLAAAYFVTGVIMLLWSQYLKASNQLELPEGFKDAGENV